MTPAEQIVQYLPWIFAAVILMAALLGYKLWLRLFGVVMIPEDSIGVVNKKFVTVGKNRTLPDGTLVALNGEAGIQADPLAPGVHFWLWPWQYQISIQKFITVAEGHVGIVEARDGKPLESGRVLAKHVACNSFQDARAFLTSGGERGPQISIIAPGTYRINTGLFTVRMADAMEIADNKVGIVTTMEGQPLPAGDIAGPSITGHNLFQNGQAFIDGGGYKGLQEQVILAGRYYINPMFVSIEEVDMTPVPIANVGVVISYVGAAGEDVTGESFKHGNLVKKGQRGVWAEPLDPGKYPINLYTHKVENVPTANVVLNWATGKTESHNLDKNLSTITVRSSDGFKFNLDVSQIIHIPRSEAPKVIARFGSMANLVTQVLEPTIGNYFRNAAQGSDVIQFLKERKQRQDDARKQISDALNEYNVNAVDTLIGDIVPPDALMETLTNRKIAEQQKATFSVQREAEDNRKELQQAKAMADTQPQVVAAERQVSIEEFNARAAVKKAEGAKLAAVLAAEGSSQAAILAAQGSAQATKLTGEAEAGKTLAVGEAEAEVTKKKIASMEAGNFAGIEIARALASSKVPLVPEVMGGTAEGGSMLSLFLASMFRDSLKAGNGKTPTAVPEGRKPATGEARS